MVIILYQIEKVKSTCRQKPGFFTKKLSFLMRNQKPGFFIPKLLFIVAPE